MGAQPPREHGVSYTELRYEVVGDVGVITLDRPEARNALDPHDAAATT